MMDNQKKEALQRLRDARMQERRSKFAEGMNKLRSSESSVLDHSLRDSNKMEVISPEAREMKVEAYRKAKRAMAGKPLEEAVGDTLDYGKMKKEMMNKGKGLGDDLRRGIKPLSKGLKMLPIVGALAAGLGSEDASAAVPVLGDAESAGMSSQDENQMMAEIQAQKDYSNSQASIDKIKALESLRKNR